MGEDQSQGRTDEGGSTRDREKQRDAKSINFTAFEQEEANDKEPDRATEQEEEPKRKNTWDSDDEDDEDQFDPKSTLPSTSSEAPVSMQKKKEEKMEVEEVDLLDASKAPNPSETSEDWGFRAEVSITGIHVPAGKLEAEVLSSMKTALMEAIEDSFRRHMEELLDHQVKIAVKTRSMTRGVLEMVKEEEEMEVKEEEDPLDASMGQMLVAPDQSKSDLEELDKIAVQRVEPPKTVRTWAECGLDQKMLNFLEKCEYSKPTPIQARAFPPIMRGRDVVGIAETGSGETLLLPIFQHILDQPTDGDGPTAVILARTRKLARRMYNEAIRIAKVLRLRVVCNHGGVEISEQMADFRESKALATLDEVIRTLKSKSHVSSRIRRSSILAISHADDVTRNQGRRSSSLPHSLDTCSFSATKLIDDLWDSGLAVPKIELTHGVSDQQAFVGEASMMKALHTRRLTNIGEGHFHGSARQWTRTQEAEYGSLILHRVYSILKVHGLT
uniref:RNA helicase n=2 Tax=Caenorhabditis tropicalis TaxID=1561998 RepID=A0A1I7U6W0_9PELO